MVEKQGSFGPPHEDDSGNGQSRNSVSEPRKSWTDTATFSLGKYCIVETVGGDGSGQPQMEWRSTDLADGIDNLFIRHEVEGATEQVADGIFVTGAENQVMNVIFRLPDQIVSEKDSEFFFHLHLAWRLP